MISIIIVSYNTKDLLKDCLDSIVNNTTAVPYEIIIMDNGSTDNTRGMVRNLYPLATFIENDQNAGFAVANNQASRIAGGEYILFLNSDTIICHEAIRLMYEHLKDNTDVGIVGPKILDRDHHPTRSYMRFFNIKMLFLGSKYLSLFIDTNQYQMHYKTYDYSAIRDVPWISGACMMMKKQIFEESGCFDENYFLYFEDMDLCLQVRKSGYKISYLPSAEIIHLFGGSSLSSSDKIKNLHINSLLYYIKKNHPVMHFWIAKLYFTLRHH